MQHNDYCNEKYVASDDAFDTTRKSAQLEGVIESGGFSVDLIDPDSFTERTTGLVHRVHISDYVDAVATGAAVGLRFRKYSKCF
jgi:hypothetical protein